MSHRDPAFGRPLRRLWIGVAMIVVACAVFIPNAVVARTLAALATPVCTFLLQALGFPAIADGHYILLYELKFDVVSACSGFSVFAIFIAITVIVTSRFDCTTWERLYLAFSAVPLMLVALFVCVTTTGVLLHWFGPRLTQDAMHPWATWAMLPAALALLGVELRYLKTLLIVSEPVCTTRPTRTRPPMKPLPAANRGADNGLTPRPKVATERLTPTWSAF